MQSLLPKAFTPARSMATRQAGRCFEEVDVLLEDLRTAPSTAAMMTEAASPAAAFTVDEATTTTTTTTSTAAAAASSWFFCPHAKSLIQLDPTVVAFSPQTNVLRLSPLIAEDEGETKKDDGGDDDGDWDIDVFLNGIFFGGESPLCPEAKSDANGGGLKAVDACFYAISDRIDKGKNTKNDGRNSDNNTNDHGNDGIHGGGGGGGGGIGQGLLHTSGAPPSASASSRQAPAPAMDPSMFPASETHPSPAPAPAMVQSLPAFASGKARPPSPSAIGTTLFPYLLEEARQAPAPSVDPSFFAFYDEARRRLPSAVLDDLSPSAVDDEARPPFPSAVGDSQPSPSYRGEERSVEAAPQRTLRGAANKDAADDIVLAEAHRAVAADEPIELEAFIVASKRRLRETKARQEEVEAVGEAWGDRAVFARAVMGVVKDASVYVSDLLSVRMKTLVFVFLYCYGGP